MKKSILAAAAVYVDEFGYGLDVVFLLKRVDEAETVVYFLQAHWVVLDVVGL